MSVVAMPIQETSVSNQGVSVGEGAAQQALMLTTLGFVRQYLPQLSVYIEEQASLIVTEFKTLVSETLEHSQRLQTVIELAQHIEMDGKKVQFEQSVEVLYEPLAEAIEKILDVSKLSMTMVVNIGNAADNITRMENSIEQVQALTKQTNMLAMNTQIEAARAGESGNSFRIIAQEVKALSERISKVSTDIKREVNSVAGSVRKSSALVDSLAHYDMTENMQLRDKVGELIDSIMAQNKGFSELLFEASEASERTAKAIQKLIVGIQFQDRSSQVIGDLCCLLDQVIDSAGQVDVSAIDEEMVAKVTGALKLSEMRYQALEHFKTAGALSATSDLYQASNSSRAAKASAKNDDDDIELF